MTSTRVHYRRVYLMLSMLICVVNSVLATQIAQVDIKPKESTNNAVSASLLPSSKVYFSSENQHGGPTLETQDSFDCTDKIFTVIELNDYPKERYALSVKWIDPLGTVRENTQYPFQVFQNETRVWAWLSLSRARGAGMISFINPAAGLEEFIGEWTIDISLNGKKLPSEHFSVIC